MFKEKFNRDGFVIFENIVSNEDLIRLDNCIKKILSDPAEFNIYDWAQRKDEVKLGKYKIIQVGASRYFPALLTSNIFQWIRMMSADLMQQEIDFWFDQFLIKPPESQQITPWHQDEAYWGRALTDKALTCWIPLHDVDLNNGCICYARAKHRKSILPHYHPSEFKSDLLTCNVNDSELVYCPIKRGSLIFHHCRTPHMSTMNNTKTWRKALSVHLKNPNVSGAGELYSWIHSGKFERKKW